MELLDYEENFKKTNNIAYLVAHLAQFGVENRLIPQANFVQMYDLDIKLCILGVVVAFLMGVKRLLTK